MYNKTRNNGPKKSSNFSGRKPRNFNAGSHSKGRSFGNSQYEYVDADRLFEIRESMKKYGAINFIQTLQFRDIKKKYGLISFDSYNFN